METQLEALQRDLARFERRTRLVWLAGLAAAALVAVLGTGARQAQSQTASVSARVIVLVDPSNRPRLILTSDTNNRPAISIRDEAGKEGFRFGFGTQPSSPFFSLEDETGRPRLIAGFNVEHGDPQMSLFDQAGRSRDFFGFGVQLRTPQLVLDDERGKDRLYAGWTQDRTPSIHVADDAGKVVWKTGDVPSGATPGTGGANPGNVHKPRAP